MKRDKTIYYVSTGVLSALMVFSAGMYVFNHAFVGETFIRLGYPTYIIYPLAALKILGLLAIWTKKSKVLKDLAYAGFFYDFILAFFAHFMAGDGEYVPSLVAFILVCTSYVMDRKLN